MKLWKFILMLGSLVLLGTVLLVGANFLVLPMLVHSNKVVAMPDLRGKDLAEARDEVHALKLVIEVAGSHSHPTLPEGSILDQIPEPDARIRGGRVVRVTISAGHASGRLASVVGLTLKQADVTLQREKFRAGRVVHLPVAGVTQPVVCYQNPQAGTELKTGEAVAMVIADPAPPVPLMLPNLKGLPLYQARQVISTAGLVLAPVQYVKSNEVSPNHILSQEPSGGSRVAKGEQLVLVVATR